MFIQTAQILALLCVAQLHYIDAKLEFVKKLHDFPAKDVKFSKHSIKNENLVFGVCEGENVDKNCTVIHQKYPYDVITHSCNLKIRVPNGMRTMPANLDARPFGKDKALLMWEGQEKDSNDTYIALSTLKMNDCERSEILLPDLFGQLYLYLYFTDKIALYDDYYELFYNGNKSYGNGVIRIRVVSRMETMEELDSRMKISDLNSILPIVTGSPANGYVYTEGNSDTTFKISVIKPNESKKLLENNFRPKSYEISAAQNTIGSCAIPRNIYCNQYDGNGILQSTTVLTDSTKNTIPFAMHISANCGFLLTLVEFKESDSDPEYDSYRMIRVDSKGKVIGKLRLEEFQKLNLKMVYCY